MKTMPVCRIVIIGGLLGIGVAMADTHYVDKANSGGQVYPYTNGWGSAADNIYSAVVAAAASDTVLVTNGDYNTGGTAVGGLTNRVYVTSAITLKSMNGPAFTSIVGAADPVITNGPSAVRCVYLTSAGASLIGFTITNGHTLTNAGGWPQFGGGGIYCDNAGTLISNCIITHCSASYAGGGAAYLGTFYNCTIADCSAGDHGGGARGSYFYNSTITRNQAPSYVGVYGATVVNCTISANSCTSGSGVYGGGYASVVFSNCTISANSAGSTTGCGGGVGQSTLYNCIVTSNSAAYGAGAIVSTLYNCLIAYNTALSSSGGGTDRGYLKNCTVVSNVSPAGGVATLDGSATNTIVYYNTPLNITAGGPYSYCCTGEQVTGPGTGNTTNPPAFVDKDGGNFRLTSGSPCVNTGTNQPWMDNTFDLDGRRRIDPISRQVDMGAYEFLPHATIIMFH